MNDKQKITEALISTLMLYAIVNNWESDRLIEEYARLGIKEEEFNRVLNESSSED